MTDFDRDYASTPALFGAEPDALLTAFSDRLEGPVLDIGCGQGRHALWLARRGVPVVGIDPSRVAVQTLRVAAADLPLEVHQASTESWQAAPGSYGGVLCLGLIPLIPVDEIASVILRCLSWTRPGGLVLLTAFTTDPDHPVAGTFPGPRTWLARGQLAEIARGITAEVSHSREAWGPWHRHGVGEPERHFVAELVLRSER